jgi:lysozyme family protein
MSKLDEGKDWTKQGDAIKGNGEAVAVFRGIQADLNFFAEKVGFELVKVDGVLGPKTLAALQATNAAVIKANPALGGTLIEPKTIDDVASFATLARDWLEKTARAALNVGDLRRYHKGTGKDWNTKDTIAYGAGPVHEEFVKLQVALNRFAETVGFTKLEADGFLGSKTAAATKKIYDATVAKSPLNAMTVFPVPDTKEEVAEYAAFIRDWLHEKAAKALLGEAGA